MNGFKKTTLTNINQILFYTEPSAAVGVVVGNTGLTAGDDGKKILKAGTPLAGNLTARNTPFVKAETTGSSPKTSNAVGILLHDVDVTEGNENATMLIFGFVNLDRLESDTAALIDEAVISALDAKVTFLK